MFFRNISQQSLLRRSPFLIRFVERRRAREDSLETNPRLSDGEQNTGLLDGSRQR